MGQTKGNGTNKKNGGKKGGKRRKPLKNIKRGPRKKQGPKSSSLEKVARDMNAKLYKKYYTDLRGPNSTGQKLQSVVVNNSIPERVETNANVFGVPLLGVISQAISKGWSLNSGDDSYIYWAWVYQANLIIQAAKGGVPFSGNVPHWLNLLVQAVIKTSVDAPGGQLSYNFDIKGNFDDNYEQLMGPVVYKLIYSLGIKGTTTINGLWPIIGAPGLYTQENGELATQNLWIFLQGHYPDDPMHKMVPFNAENDMTNDGSAFAFFSNAPGGGQQDTGAWFKQVFFERKIKSPKFSVFAPIPQTGVPRNRAQVEFQMGSCDGVTLGAMMIDGLGTKQLHGKNPIRPYFIDAMEFVQVYALAIQKALVLRGETDAFKQNMKDSPSYYIDYVRCPLTIQEFTLLVIASLKLVFTDTIKLQGIFPRAPFNGTDSEFVVLNCGIQTTPIPMGNMMLFPTVLRENILALRSRTLFSKGKDPLIYMGALGMYFGDRLNPDNYNVEYSLNGVTEVVPAFFSYAGEADINPIDGSYAGGIAAINDPVTLVALADVFNDWIQGMGDHFRQLDTLVPDDGIEALTMSGMMSHWVTAGREEKALMKHTDRTIPRAKGRVTPPVKGEEVLTPEEQRLVEIRKMPRRRQQLYIRETGDNLKMLYGTRNLVAYTSQYEVIQEVWTNLQQFFIAPINSIDFNEVSERDNTGFNRVAAFMREFKQIDTGTGSVQFTTLFERHEALANLLVKTKFAFELGLEALLQSLNDRGKSGLLGRLGMGLAAELGHNAIDVGADLLADVIPF